MIKQRLNLSVLKQKYKAKEEAQKSKKLWQVKKLQIYKRKNNFQNKNKLLINLKLLIYKRNCIKKMILTLKILMLLVQSIFPKKRQYKNNVKNSKIEYLFLRMRKVHQPGRCRKTQLYLMKDSTIRNIKRIKFKRNGKKVKKDYKMHYNN